MPGRPRRLADVVRNITLGAPHKIGSQYVVSRHGCCPARAERARALETLAAARASLGGEQLLDDGAGLGFDGACSWRELIGPARTDLHSEPIASVAVQLRGSKRWTLVDAPPTVVQPGRRRTAARTSGACVPRSTASRAATGRGREGACVRPAWTWRRSAYDHRRHRRRVALPLGRPPLSGTSQRVVAILPNLAGRRRADAAGGQKVATAGGCSAARNPKLRHAPTPVYFAQRTTRHQQPRPRPRASWRTSRRLRRRRHPRRPPRPPRPPGPPPRRPLLFLATASS